MIKKFFRDETGLELSEYAVAAALVAIAVVGAFTALGTAISGKITTLGSRRGVRIRTPDHRERATCCAGHEAQRVGRTGHEPQGRVPQRVRIGVGHLRDR